MYFYIIVFVLSNRTISSLASVPCLGKITSGLHGVLSNDGPGVHLFHDIVLLCLVLVTIRLWRKHLSRNFLQRNDTVAINSGICHQNRKIT